MSFFHLFAALGRSITSLLISHLPPNVFSCLLHLPTWTMAAETADGITLLHIPCTVSTCISILKPLYSIIRFFSWTKWLLLTYKNNNQFPNKLGQRLFSVKCALSSVCFVYFEPQQSSFYSQKYSVCWLSEDTQL